MDRVVDLIYMPRRVWGWGYDRGHVDGSPGAKHDRGHVANDREIDEAADEATTRGLRAILASAIIGAWTASEVLLEDLWLATARHDPARMLRAKGGKAKLAKGVVVEADTLAGGAFRIECETSASVTQVLGANFRSYKTISKAYHDAFQRTFHSLDTNLDRSLFNLSQVRNAIVHRAGVADHKLIKNIGEAPGLPRFHDLAEGIEIPIDGDVVSALVDGAVKSCVKLIEDVDRWASSSGPT